MDLRTTPQKNSIDLLGMFSAIIPQIYLSRLFMLEYGHEDNNLAKIGEDLKDPFPSCLDEGWYRHCVSSCILQNYLNLSRATDGFTQLLARAWGRDLPWDSTIQNGDIAANSAGINLAMTNGIGVSCKLSCRMAYEDEVERSCCGSNVEIDITDAKCCLSAGHIYSQPNAIDLLLE